ncbi:MAG TPA: DUF2846 domain-containing protein [Candidatus Sulfotelmatobacter sp.]|nr:DUF2846 domain-containing protein [Candidatus Sulfotelmatobacter sp.]
MKSASALIVFVPVVFVMAAFASIVYAAPAAAQDHAAIASAEAACGPKDAIFEAKQDAMQHPVAQPDSGKAVVYMVQEVGAIPCKGCALTKVGMDGAWVGANQGSSYFFFSAEPGEHHLCVNWQSRLEERSRAFAMANFVAEAGKVYYFRIRIFPGHADYTFDLDAVNPDQGKFLVAASAFSASHPKK